MTLLELSLVKEDLEDRVKAWDLDSHSMALQIMGGVY